MKKGKILFLVIFMILISSSGSALNITSRLNNQEEAIIKGTVESAVTCIPDSLSDVTIKAKNLNPINSEIYTTKTDSKGEFELEVTKGKYLITAEKNNYRLTSPKIGYIKTVESEKTYNLSFYMVPSEGKIHADNGYTNLTIQETWEFIKTPDNGIHYLIDVRTKEEYTNERIDTPSIKEKPRLFPLQWIEDENLLKTFFTLYEGKKIILYCRSANRSFIAAKILIDNNFQGEIFNMMGGIKEWKNQGLPTVSGIVRGKTSVIENRNTITSQIIQYFPILTKILTLLQN